MYVKVTGDKAGLTINQSGWYTIGKSENVPGMGTPYWYMHGSHSFSDVGVSYKTVLKTNFTRWTDNQKIDLDQITWTEFYVDNGADDYVKAGTYTWHMNGTIDIKQLPSVYTIKYVDYDTKELIHSYEESGLMGQTPKKITAPDSWQENLYSFYFVNGHPKEQTVDFKKDKGELTFYYKKNTAKLTINYVYKDGSKAAESHEAELPYQSDYSVESPVIEGYTANNLVVSGTMPANDVEVTVTYTKRTDLSYTVNYLEKVTNKVLHDQKVQGGMTYEDTITSANEKIDISGYNYDSVDPETLTIGTGENVINIYYTKRNDLSYTVNYLEKVTNKVLHDQKVQGGMTYEDTITSANEKIDISGYNYDSVDPETLTIGTGENVINLYYTKKTNLSYKVNYLEQGTTNVLHEQKVQGEMTFDDVVKSEDEVIEINGYNYASADKETLTIGTGENVINLYYTKQTNLSYKVNYLEQGTTNVLHEQKVQGEMTFDDVVKSEDEVIEINGYNYASADKETLTIGTGENVINLYYTKRTDLSYTVKYLEKGTNKKLHDEKTASNKTFGDVVDPKDEVIGINGYNYDSASPETLTIGTDDNVLTLYYTKRTDLRYTVKYLEKGTNKKLHDEKTASNKTFGDVVDPKDEVIGINGYNYDSASPETLTIGTDDNVLTLYYTKRTDLSYTVNYYWNETTEKVADSKIVENQTFDDEVTEFPEKDIPGCTPVSPDPKTITIGTGTNEINFYYYKNVELEANSATLSYNGKAQSVSGFTGAPEDADFSNIIVGATGTDAETYPAEFAKKTVGTVDVTEKYIVTAANNGQLVINPRSVTLTSASASKVYDGKPLTNDTVAVGGDGFVKDEGATYKVTGSQTVVGESDNTFTYTLNKGTKADNYDIKTENGTLTVTPVTDKVTVTITGNTASEKYDGTEKTASGYGVSISNEKYTEADFEFKGNAEVKGTDANTYPMGLTSANFTNKSTNFTNVEFVVTDGSLTINKRNVTLTSASDSKVYDGTPLTNDTVTVGGDGFVEGQVKEIKATGSVTNAGSVANTITFTPNKETFKEGNYAITKTEGTLTIAKRSVLITSQSATKTYDGSALTRPAVTITGDGFVPGELAKAEATGSITKVGSTPNAIQYTTTGAFNAANYSIALSVGTLTVTEKPKPEPRRTFNLTINYVYQNGKRAAASYNRGGLKNGETFDITSPVIAGYTASETVVSGTIYNRDIKVTVIYTADGVNLDDYGVPLGLGNITMNVGDCFE